MNPKETNTPIALAPSGSTRMLKIEATGDFYLRKIKPRIRITGKWLERAGFKPGHHVVVSLDQPGTMTLRFVEQAQGVAR